MRNRKILAMAGVSAMMIGLVACGSKAESNIAESATPAPTAEATPTPEPTGEPAESHDFDSSVNKYKSESDIEIKQYSGDSASDMADCDSGTDIEDIKDKTEKLTEQFHTISTKLYQQAQANGAAGGFDPNNMGAAGAASGEAQSAPNDNVVDADFEVVDDEENK